MNKDLTPKAYLNINFPLSIEEWKLSPDQMYDALILPSFQNAVKRQDKLLIMFGNLRPSLDYLTATIGRLASEFGVTLCKKHLKIVADYKDADKMVNVEIYEQFQ